MFARGLRDAARDWITRRALDRRYHAVALPRPRFAFVGSPFAAAIATGIATGARWLRRHPETHPVLFRRPIDAAGLAGAVRDAAATAIPAVLGRDEPGVAAAVGRAVATVIDQPAYPLPAALRPAATPMEAVDAAPRLAASEGWLEDRLFTGPLATLRGAIPTQLAAEDEVGLGLVNDAISTQLDAALTANVAGRAEPSSPAAFLVRCLVAWWQRRRPFDHRLEDLAVILPLGTGGEGRRREVRDLLRIARRTGGVFVHAEFWIAAHRPRAAFDARARLHRIGGPAVVWCDGTGLSFLHGVRVTEDVACGRFGVTQILDMRNAEVRRTMIELYERDDRGRFVREAGGDVIHVDHDHLGHARRLLRIALPGDEPYVVVEVVNSTPEPDGSHRTYLLRVPPTITTCRAAVAWTFGLTELEYDPVEES